MKYSLFIEKTSGKIKCKGLVELESTSSLKLESGEVCRYLLPPASVVTCEANAKKIPLKELLIRDSLFTLTKTPKVKISWEMGRIGKCLDEAFETYTDLLSENDSLSQHERDQAEIQFRKDLYNQDPEKVSLSDLALAKRLHDYKFDDGVIKREGVIVVMTDLKGRSLILDGNHRVNSESDPNLKLYVVKVSGVRYPKDEY